MNEHPQKSGLSESRQRRLEELRAKYRPSPSQPEERLHELRANPPTGYDPDRATHWCSWCGMPDAPVSDDISAPDPPCPACGSTFRWSGRFTDYLGTATTPPDDGTCTACYQWRRYPTRQEHFGWAWWRICPRDCQCAHHKDEIWIA
jgi:hypothetical protein